MIAAWTKRSGWWAFDFPTSAAPTSAWSPSFARLVRLMFDGPGEDHGLILREGNEAVGTFHQWTELNTSADLPDELFSFDPDIDAPAEPRACR